MSVVIIVVVSVSIRPAPLGCIPHVCHVDFWTEFHRGRLRANCRNLLVSRSDQLWDSGRWQPGYFEGLDLSNGPWQLPAAWAWWIWAISLYRYIAISLPTRSRRERHYSVVGYMLQKEKHLLIFLSQCCAGSHCGMLKCLDNQITVCNLALSPDL